MANYTKAHMIDAVRSKGVRYSLVSVVNVLIGGSLLVLFATILGWNPVVSNVLAVCISAAPAYVLNRAWVWGKSGKNSLTAEILPFWGFTLAGLALSTAAVALVRNIDFPFIANLANLTAFGVLWLLKFFLLDALLFGPHHHLGDEASLVSGPTGDAPA